MLRDKSNSVRLVSCVWRLCVCVLFVLFFFFVEGFLRPNRFFFHLCPRDTPLYLDLLFKNFILNYTERLPWNIGRLTKLVQLNLSYNALTEPPSTLAYCPGGAQGFFQFQVCVCCACCVL